MKASKEFENFDRTMREVLKVSHDEIKAKLDAEKVSKKRKKPKKSSASREAV
jgi:hypothetical protein